jgi:hypothetical protein
MIVFYRIKKVFQFPNTNIMKKLSSCVYKLLFAVLILITQNQQSFSQNIRYVKPIATGTSDGSSWANASANLQAMINALGAGADDQVWVKGGTYKPTTGTDRTISFSMKAGVKIYGSFAGTETALSQRTAAVMAANTSTLSGDLNGDDVITGAGSTLTISNNSENSNSIIFNNYNSLTTTNSLLDGFTIKGGNAASGTPAGGMCNYNSSTSLSNVTFLGNNSALWGGAIYNGLSSMILNNVTFLNNNSEHAGGGAMYNSGSTLISLNNVTFSGNNSTLGHGGGVYNEAVETISLNSVSFSNNNAVGVGGGIFIIGTNFLDINNTAFTGNTAVEGGGMYSLEISTSSTINNSIFSGNTATSGGGGGMVIEESTFINISNTIFTGNSANAGGGILNESFSTSLDNVTFSGNTATTSGGGMLNFSLNLIIKNSIFWGNKVGATTVSSIENDVNSTPIVTYSNVEMSSGVYAGTGNINKNPLFLNAANPAGADGIFRTADDGLALTICSPANNTGDDAGVTNTDIIGNVRPYVGAVAVTDMGAYEYQGDAKICSTAPTGVSGTTTICVGSSTTLTLVGGSAGTNAVAKWYSGSCGGTLVGTGNSVAVSPTTNTTYFVRYEGDCNNTTCASQAITVTSISNAAIATANISQTLPVTSVTYFSNSCTNNLITKLSPNGVSPISGSTDAKVWIETAQPAQFVKRHYEITPTNNAATATGNVTLYFTQAEFDAFNAVNTLKQLPANGADATGKANLVIEKRPGISSDGTGLPGTYTGTPVTIDPVDTDIIWNAAQNRWEVSFDVTGFSGFFVKTQSGVLPVTIQSFNAIQQTNDVLVKWQTSNEVNVNLYEVESSIDGQRFEKIGTVAANSANSANDYAFVDKSVWASSVRYYRLKSIDNDGTFKYSAVVRLANKQQTVVSVYPNPVSNAFTIQLSDNKLLHTQAKLVDATGKTVKLITINTLMQTEEISNLPKGLYMLQLADGKVVKLIKN